MIIESAVITATNADILNNATNNFTLTIQEANGDVPIDAQPVPGANPSLGGVLDERQLFRFTMGVAQGSHVNISLTETGAAICMWRAVLRP